MIKKARSIFLTAILSICFALISHQAYAATTSILVNCDKQQLNVGDSVSMTVENSGGVHVWGVQFELHYDHSVLELQTVDHINPYQSVSTVENNGNITYYLLQNTKDVSNTLNKFANINFKVIGKGSPNVSLQNIKAIDLDMNVINDNINYTLPIGINNPVNGVVLNKSATTILVGNSETLIATVSPADATNKDVTWMSSNQQIAKVDVHGNVTALLPGTATITVTSVDQGKTAICSVTCQSQPPVQPPADNSSATKLAAITSAINAINSLPDNVTITDKTQIVTARNLVSQALQLGAVSSDITNIAKLTSSETKIIELEKAAADKAAADKAAADKAAADKAAADKAAADKAAADKAAADKAAADKVAADKAAADKAAADKAVADKAAADKAAADKAAADKAAADKAAADKAAADKAAADKAAADKAAADKAAADKAAIKAAAEKAAAEKLLVKAKATMNNLTKTSLKPFAIIIIQSAQASIDKANADKAVAQALAAKAAAEKALIKAQLNASKALTQAGKALAQKAVQDALKKVAAADKALQQKKDLANKAATKAKQMAAKANEAEKVLAKSKIKVKAK